MSTRCNIILQREGTRERVYLYHHHDGYPEGVGADLLEFVKGMNEAGRFYDLYRIANHLIKGLDSSNLAGSDGKDNGYELTDGLHSDIEYLYVITIRPQDNGDGGMVAEELELKSYARVWFTDYERVSHYGSELTAIDGLIVVPCKIPE